MYLSSYILLENLPIISLNANSKVSYLVFVSYEFWPYIQFDDESKDFLLPLFKVYFIHISFVHELNFIEFVTSYWIYIFSRTPASLISTTTCLSRSVWESGPPVNTARRRWFSLNKSCLSHSHLFFSPMFKVGKWYKFSMAFMFYIHVFIFYVYQIIWKEFH